LLLAACPAFISDKSREHNGSHNVRNKGRSPRRRSCIARTDCDDRHEIPAVRCRRAGHGTHCCFPDGASTVTPANRNPDAARRFRCPSCGGRAERVPNPYFGVGLAVHRHVGVCSECDWVELAPPSGTRRWVTPSAGHITIQRASFPCPECAAPVKATRNPHYGIGLAVHEYVRVCMVCDWFELALGSPEAQPAVPVEVVTAPPPTFGSRFRSLWNRPHQVRRSA
jgi:hypothetical protein